MDMLSLMPVNLGEIGRASKSGCADQVPLGNPTGSSGLPSCQIIYELAKTEEIDMFFTKTNSRRWELRENKTVLILSLDVL